MSRLNPRKIPQIYKRKKSGFCRVKEKSYFIIKMDNSEDPKSSEIINNMDMIDERLYLGNFDSTFYEENLRSAGITHILGVMDSFDFYRNFEGITYMQIRLYDFAQVDILKHIPKALTFISQATQSGKVLVHCQLGVSRSASIVASYLMVSRSLDFKSALEIIRQSRPCACPNPGFERQLSSIDINDYKQYLT